MMTLMALCAAFLMHGQDATTSTLDSIGLDEIVVTHRSAGTNRLGGAVDATRINKQELFKAACCNLGESFTTNPSVDVNYSDAATGARQIKLLGLSGTYVQMLAENLPNWRGNAIPYALGYVPGPWMKSILVSKGTSSVRNGYESITGKSTWNLSNPRMNKAPQLTCWPIPTEKLKPTPMPICTLPVD